MEKEKKIKMPEPIHIKKINTKLDFFSKNNVIRQWPAYDIIDTLFYLYLFNKYKHNCLIKYQAVTSVRSLGVELQIDKNLSNVDTIKYEKHLQVVSKQLSQCIEKNPDSIIIPLYLKTKEGGHANILIYRKNNNIEHFEPHGSNYLSANTSLDKKIKIELNKFIDLLNSKLKKNNKPLVNLIPSYEVCPYIYGLQSLAEQSNLQRSPLEGKGYCAAWSMFFTELVLKNPTIPSNELLSIIINKFDKEPEKQKNYIRQIILGYINLIHNKIEKYFSFLYNTKITIDNIADLSKRGQLTPFLINYHTLINVQNELFKNPSLTKKEYLKILDHKRLKTTNPDDKMEIDREIYFLKKMDEITPSPVSSKSKSNSISKSISKSNSISKSSKVKTPPKSNKKTRKQKQSIKKEIICPQGSQINPKTGRCNKIKVYPPCPPTRDPITHRCKSIK